MDKKIILLILIIIVVFSGCMETKEQPLNTSYTQETRINASEDACPIGSDKCGDANAKADPCEGVKELLALGEYECCDKNRNYNKSIEYYTNAIELAPNCSDAYVMRGFAYGTRAFWEDKDEEYYKGIEDLDKALEIDPNNSNALFIKGMWLNNIGKEEEAKEVYKKTLEINPDDVMAKQEYEELSKGS